MAQKEYLKMADFVKPGVTVTPYGFVAGINYEAASGELIIRDVYAALSHAISSHDELVAEVERLRGALSASMSVLHEVERVTSELIKNGCDLVDDINAEVSYSIKLVEAIEE